MSEERRALKYGELQPERSTIERSPEVARLQQAVRENPHDAKLWFELSQACKAMNLCREAVEAMGRSISLDPFNAQAYRFKGHYNINIGRFQEASADLTIASRLDPTDWSIWYHLGLATYLAEDYARADEAFSQCLRMATTFEMKVDSVNWLWMTRMYMGQPERAAEVLALIPRNHFCDSHEYYDRCMVFAGYVDPEAMLAHARIMNEHLYVTEAYGVAAYYELTGNMERADEVFDEIEAHSDVMWSGFAEHAIRCRQARRRKQQSR